MLFFQFSCSFDLCPTFFLRFPLSLWPLTLFCCYYYFVSILLSRWWNQRPHPGQTRRSGNYVTKMGSSTCARGTPQLRSSKGSTRGGLCWSWKNGSKERLTNGRFCRTPCVQWRRKCIEGKSKRQKKMMGKTKQLRLVLFPLPLLEFVIGSRLTCGWASLEGKLGFLLVGCLVGNKTAYGSKILASHGFTKSTTFLSIN